VVDLYPFEATVASGAAEPEVIEKIDIGGISLIRAAAKNYRDVLIVPSRDHYAGLLNILSEQEGTSALADRKQLAQAAFALTAHYDTAINGYFAGGAPAPGPNAQGPARTLRYGENPHQEGVFYGDLDALFDQLHGKELSYNNLLDIDAAVHLMADFADNDPTVAILKHNNACGLATRSNLPEAWKDALAGDPVSAFGGIIVTNRPVDRSTAEGMHEIFFEVVIAPDYTPEALEVLQQKKKRIILRQKQTTLPAHQFRTALNGMLFQNRDARTETPEDLRTVTEKAPSAAQVNDLLFANKLVKHTKSNTIVLAANGQLLASGTGQTSRVDALKQAIVKARAFGFDLQGAVMASDAFFPFPDCVEIAHEAGINAVIQPGGSIRDEASIDFCNENGMSMVFTGIRHFKH
ncbi:MAG: bifunctional phosphoribosylaminoimidazolecarboxamide formyltransferase/IMP cyclohydrolase, partial [Bacteroidota bacterium]